MSLTFRLAMDSKLPTERNVQQGDTYLQVRSVNPHEEPVDIEAQILVNTEDRIFSRGVHVTVLGT